MMSMHRLLVLLPCVFLLTQACDDDTTKTTPTGEADAGHDASHTGHEGDDDDDDQPVSTIRCTDAELAANASTDGGSVVISFPTGAEPAQYTNHCLTVKAGSSVTFTGAFLQHPLVPAGGDEPNPIPATTANQPDDALAVTFPNAGTFGYQCDFHPAQMYGAIRVVP